MIKTAGDRRRLSFASVRAWPRHDSSFVSWKGVAGLALLCLALVLLLHHHGHHVVLIRHAIFIKAILFQVESATSHSVPQSSQAVPLVKRPKRPEGPQLQPWPVDSQLKYGVGGLCPYNRIPYSRMQRHVLMPYILGEERRPACVACNTDVVCRYQNWETEMVCPPSYQHRMLEYLLSRAEEGAPGYAEMLSMTPCDLLPLFWGRTLWLVGDSQTSELAMALRCLFREFHKGIHTSAESFGGGPDVAARLEFSFCMQLAESTRICHLRNNKISEYWGWLDEFAAYYRSHASHMPYLIWRDNSPQHFQTATGDFACEGCEPVEFPFKCQAVEGVRLNSRNQLEVTEAGKEIVAEGGWRNIMAGAVMRGLGIPIMATWNQSLPLWQYHHHLGKGSMHECTHSCHPSVYEVWIYLLYEILRQESPNFPPSPAKLPQYSESEHGHIPPDEDGEAEDSK